MEYEEIDQTLKLLEEIKCFFLNLKETEKKLIADLANKEAEFCDIYHEIELSDLNAVEIIKIHKQEKKVLQERRDLKNKIEFINTCKSYVNKFIEKGICGETEEVIKNIKTLQKNQQSKQYTPRILKDLKCAKKKEKKQG